MFNVHEIHDWHSDGFKVEIDGKAKKEEKISIERQHAVNRVLFRFGVLCFVSYRIVSF